MRLLNLVALLATLAALGAAAAAGNSGPEPEDSEFEFRAVLRPAADPDGLGKVRFRQPVDADKKVYLDVWMRDLAPNHGYYLERAAEPTAVDGNPACAEANWARLGKPDPPELIVTNDIGTGTAAGLWRNLAMFATGTQFDIAFRVVDATTGAVVLKSGCYHFTLRQ
jgi:hypothetical protein